MGERVTRLRALTLAPRTCELPMHVGSQRDSQWLGRLAGRRFYYVFWPRSTTFARRRTNDVRLRGYGPFWRNSRSPSSDTPYDLLILGQVSMFLWLRMKFSPDCHLLSRSSPQRSNLVHITSTRMTCPLRYDTSPIK